MGKKKKTVKRASGSNKTGYAICAVFSVLFAFVIFQISQSYKKVRLLSVLENERKVNRQVTPKGKPFKKRLLDATNPEKHFNKDHLRELFADYAGWTPRQKVQAVTEIMDVQDLPSSVKDLFVAEIQNDDNEPLLRNNMAEALIGQREVDRSLEKLFLKIYNDTN